jgi:hypothetical protein
VTPFSAGLVRQLLERTDETTDSKARGDLLEKLASHILGSIPGVKVTHSDILNVHHSEEIDLVLFNQRLPDGLEMFEPFIFVECKNTKDPVGAPALTLFGRKLESRNASLGILVARFGIAGDREELSAAQHSISGELGRGREIVVITEKDLGVLESADDVVELLIRRRSSLLATCGFVQDDGWQDHQSADEAPEEKPATGQFFRGWEGIRNAIQSEREQLVSEMLRDAPKLAEDLDAAAAIVIDQSNALHTLLATTPPEPEEAEHWREVLRAMLDLGATASALLERHGAWERDPADIVASMDSYKPNIRHISLSSRLYSDTLTYYTLEIVNEKEFDGRSASLALIGLMVESYRHLEDSLYEYMASQGP